MFKKGENVILIDGIGKGVVSITEATVKSCGKKRMVLNRRDTGECLGTEFKPSEHQYGVRVVVRDSGRDDAEALAIEQAAKGIDSNIEHLNKCLGGPYAAADHRYKQSLAIDLKEAKDHVPSFIWR